MTRPLCVSASVSCRGQKDRAARCRAVELYKELQHIVQKKHGTGNDQNALVLKMVSDALETIDEYGKGHCHIQSP